MKYIELSEAIVIHEKIIEKTGGLSGYCVKFHPFADGNKRTSIFLGMHFLDLDGKYNDKFAEVMEDIVVGVADDSITKDDLNQILQNFIDKNISNKSF